MTAPLFPGGRSFFKEGLFRLLLRKGCVLDRWYLRPDCGAAEGMNEFIPSRPVLIAFLILC
ncbi:MAG: hypothetical protein AVO34_11745 [Firmicutes bacterium ML8_F2]|nr:MAG: hypothetical protein AVO34_11745 [Firmicutes bacterium ML8_F2]